MKGAVSMNLHHLRYFVTLAHLEHYTKAAKQLSITQPSLSHAIAALEEELNVRLFEKDGRSVVLTRWGNVFLKDVEEILAHLDSSVANLKMTGTGNGTIDIGCVRVLGASYVPGLMREFIKANPDKTFEDYYNHIAKAIREEQVYAYITHSHPNSPQTQYSVDFLSEKGAP
jgi:DNA-binding transcriptional LysR family regulator